MNQNMKDYLLDLSFGYEPESLCQFCEAEGTFCEGSRCDYAYDVVSSEIILNDEDIHGFGLGCLILMENKKLMTIVDTINGKVKSLFYMSRKECCTEEFFYADNELFLI